jgi:hypothetical protein
MDAVASERLLSMVQFFGRLGKYGTVAIPESGPTASGSAVTVVRHAGTGLSTSASHVQF